ncbi:hypothetical protein [Sphingomonas segetis]|jgi:hypothetical protein|uniref:hypothetical protein n=1 Tax=Sphingomonas segetis TaxID=1104779 RepID=UPI0012D34BAC|nr:hypothetical protein [Sphingomonas segetis]
MNGNSSNRDQRPDLDDVLEQEPESSHGDQGEAANGGEQAGPNSDRAGAPIAPQTGNPRARDRRLS